MAEKESEITLRIRRSFAAPRNKVFRAWTQPEHLKKWFAPSDEYTVDVELDFRVGGRYRVTMNGPTGQHILAGVYREIKAPEKLVYTWAWEDKPEFGSTVVSVEFTDNGSETDMLLTHEFFPDEDARNQHDHGWNGCLNRLTQKMEQGAF